MKTEIIFLAYLPALISASIIVFSYTIFLRLWYVRFPKSLINALFFLLIVLLNGIALSYFMSMLKGASPQLTPYLLVLASIPVFILYILTLRKDWD